MPIDWNVRPNASRDAARLTSSASGGATESYIALLELEPIQREIRPARWAAQRRRVLSVVQHVARGMIGAADSLAIHGDEYCVITFGETTYDDASRSALAIGERIVRSLFGEQGAKRVKFAPRVLALKDLSAKGGVPGMHIALQALLPPARDVQEARRAPSAPSAGVPADLAAHGPAAPPGPEDRRARRQRILGMFGDAQSASVYDTYVPIWNIERKTADRFQLLPRRDNGHSAPRYGYAALGSDHTDRGLIAFDMEAIELGLLALKQAIDAGLHCELMLPLHFDTAGSNQGRSELMEIFPNLPSFVRGRLSFALFGVPDGVPETRLYSIAGTLVQLVKEVVVVLEPSAGYDAGLRIIVSRIRSAGVQGIAISFPPARPEEGLEGASAIAGRAAAAGMTACALGLVSGRQAHRLAVAGCTRFGGPLFGGPFFDLPAPYPVHAKVFEQSD
jgi:hypothetical protein